MQFHLSGGRNANGEQLLDPEFLAATYLSNSINVEFNDFLPFFPVPVVVDSYAMGWWSGSYRGRFMLFHTGNAFGHSAVVVLLPYDHLGFVALLNMNGL